jgi:spermidine/putrescine transport system permease protein
MRRWLTDPWRRPRLLEALVWGYLAWSVLPVAIAVWFSFNAGRSRSSWQGFSLRWYWQDPVLSVWHDPELQQALVHSLRLAALTTLVAVPLGVAFAIGIDRWRGRLAAGFNFQMLLSFVVPEILLAVALLFLFTNLLKAVQLGAAAQLLGLVTFQLSYPVIICRARLLSIGREYEEAAMDLGASPVKALRHVLLPLLSPAIFASAVLVFADVIDDFVLVRYLSAGRRCRRAGCPLSMCGMWPPYTRRCCARARARGATCWLGRRWRWWSWRGCLASSPAAACRSGPPRSGCCGLAAACWTGCSGWCRCGCRSAPKRWRRPWASAPMLRWTIRRHVRSLASSGASCARPWLTPCAGWPSRGRSRPGRPVPWPADRPTAHWATAPGRGSQPSPANLPPPTRQPTFSNRELTGFQP